MLSGPPLVHRVHPKQMAGAKVAILRIAKLVRGATPDVVPAEAMMSAVRDVTPAKGAKVPMRGLAPAKAVRRRILKAVLAEVTSSADRNLRLVRRCGIRRRAACHAVEAKVRLVLRVKVETSAQVVAANAKVLTAVGRLVVASREGHLRLWAIAKDGAKVGAVVCLRKRLLTKLRFNHQTKLFRNNSMAAMLRANSQPMSLGLRSNDTVGTLAADARSVGKPESGFRRSFRAPVLVRVVKSKSGFALDESPSTASLRFSAFALGRRITCASMDA